MSVSERVVIIGAGLAGSLVSIYLARRGMAVDIYEARGDMRRSDIAAGRSINLALSDRGIAALSEVGMDEYMLAEAVPMYGRMVHTDDGETKLLPYSGRKGEYINSVSRAGLNVALINEAEKYDGVRFHFNQRCIDFDCETGEAILAGGKRVKGDTLIATDGAGSAVRHAMMHGCIERFDFSQKWLEHGYKELHIPSATDRSVSVPPALASSSSDIKLHRRQATEGSRFLLEPNALHIWPRHRFMMIALPNFDGSFTCTLFLAHKSEPGAVATGLSRSHRSFAHGGSSEQSAGLSFDGLTTEEMLWAFFETEFPDAIPLMPTLVEDFFTNPVGNLGTIKCWPWNVRGEALLLGDSAHPMVPFYGQGMNCAFEDVRVLDQLIEQYGSKWETIYEEYGLLRKANTDAITDMAEENFYEMRDAVADPVFVRKRELETRLEQTYPDYFSKYSMVTFRGDLPYAVAKKKGNAQDRLLMAICEKKTDSREVNLEEVMRVIRNENSETG